MKKKSHTLKKQFEKSECKKIIKELIEKKYNNE